MKKIPDTQEKTSRRNFTKTVATALVAVPAISSLSSCAKTTSTTNSTAPTTPSPQPSGTPQRLRAGNPPVIIDGGSLAVLTPATLDRVDDTETVPKQFDEKYVLENAATLGRIKAIRIVNDYADDLLPERDLAADETLKVYLWVQKVKKENGDDDDDTDTAEYDPVDTLPDLVIQGGPLEIRADEEISKARKLFKHEGRNHKRYEQNRWGGKKFRIAKVEVYVSTVTAPIYTSTALDNGMRIILIF